MLINLLPPKYKEELRQEENFRLALILGILVLSFFLCFSMLLVSIRIYLAGEINAQKVVVEAQRKEGEELRLQEIRKLNEEVKGASSFYEKRIVVSDIVERISSALPANVRLSSLLYAPSAQTAKGDSPTASRAKIGLAGFAPRTEDLLEIRTNLEQDSLFKNFQFPPSNWVRAENINFSFDFEL